MVATNRGVDDAYRVVEVPPHDRPIHATDVARRQRAHQEVVRALGSGHDQKPSRADVETMHNSRAVRLTDIGDLGIASE
ncbi:unannotated protein [freshwater metagenome]|uniref:Unannotated protein n=1 Tax=freshwater metagenome TaxID=449393 RepID=A0A6J7ATN9_9ZZZZ